MGTLISISCNSCDYVKEIQLGTGFAYGSHRMSDFDSKDSIIKYYIRSKKTFEFVKELILEKNGAFMEYELKLYHCSTCSSFYDRFYYKIAYDDGVFVSTYKCPGCKRVLDQIQPEMKNEWEEGDYDLTPYPCPQCAKKSLEYYKIGLWD